MTSIAPLEPLPIELEDDDRLASLKIKSSPRFTYPNVYPVPPA